METVLMAEEVTHFDVFEERLKQVWTAFRKAEGLPETFKISMTLASGVVDLQGINVTKVPGDKAGLTVSIEAPGSTVSAWKYEWFKAWIVKKARDFGITEPLNNAQIYSAYIRAATGETISNYQIGAVPAADGQADRPFSVVASKQRKEIYVVIRRARDLLNKQSRDSLLQLVNQAVVKMSDGRLKYNAQKKDFITALQGVLEGPEVVGENLPAVLLAAHAAEQPAKPAGQEIMPGHIYFTVSEDRMEASVAGFDMSWYGDPSFDISMAWIQSELKRCPIRAKVDEESFKKISDMIAGQEDLNGVPVCYGILPEGGREPYIFQSYKEMSSRMPVETQDGSIDLRDLQQRQIVKEGQLIAELRYKKPPQNGVDVYGSEVEPKENDDLIIHVGEGVLQKGRRFYATYDGVPTIENETISLSKSMVFNGDVNLRSGNIRFDGPVEIKGSVDNGATVETTGDLVIHGTIRGAFIKAGSNITVYSGIVTGNQGSVYAGGDIQAEFVENSNITCRGSLRVGKALLNCRVVSNGSIELRAKDGVLAGGKLICRERVRAGNLGFKRGAVTELVVGIDWRVARRIEIRRARLANLEKASQDYRQNLRELVQKSKNQMTAKHKQMKDELQAKLVKVRPIIERMEKYIQELTAQLSFNPEAKILVSDQLVANVKIQLCGQAITVPNDVASVGVVPKRRRGSYIVPLEEVEAEERDAGSQKAG
jgi:hypothetical protein